MTIDPTKCPHDDVANTTTYGDQAADIESGICVDCGAQVVCSQGDTDWEALA